MPPDQRNPMASCLICIHFGNSANKTTDKKGNTAVEKL
jgi:hypothetical protein